MGICEHSIGLIPCGSNYNTSQSHHNGTKCNRQTITHHNRITMELNQTITHHNHITMELNAIVKDNKMARFVAI